MKTCFGITLFVFALLISSVSYAEKPYKEKDYQEAWCTAQGGKTEVVLTDKTRVDCLTPDYAIEVDFAPKWAEAVGQSMHYSRLTGRPPGVLLIVEKPSDEKYVERLKDTAYWIRVWTIGPENLLTTP